MGRGPRLAKGRKVAERVLSPSSPAVLTPPIPMAHCMGKSNGHPVPYVARGWAPARHHPLRAKEER